MQERIASLETELQDRHIHLSVAGSIAEATVDITGIFTVAQTTADLYLREIACMKEETERECAARIEEANRAVEKIMSDGKKQFAELKLLYQAEYRKWQQLHKAVETLENPETQK
jgi:hypothetical protein